MENNIQNKLRKCTQNGVAKNSVNGQPAKQYTRALTVDEMTSSDFQRDQNAHIEVAAQLLKDTATVGYFKEAIFSNRHLFRDRVVLNIDCGMGLLALFAAKAGAKRVYAIDASNVVDYTRRIVAANGYENVIEIIKAPIDEVEIPMVDIILCDWMGYSLLFQSKCDAVIYARDKWLKKRTGLIFPDAAKLFIAFVEDGQHKNERVDWWRNVYGFNMECIREIALSEPIFQTVQPQKVLSTQFPIKTWNMYTVTMDDLKLRSKFLLKILGSGRVDGIVTFFHVHFMKSHTPMSFSTDPWSPQTRWMQSVFYFDEPLSVNTDDDFFGGIEMFPKNDLNNMEAGIEVFRGDPSEMNLELELRWQLRPHVALPDETDNKSNAIETINEAAFITTTTSDVDNDNTSKMDLSALLSTAPICKNNARSNCIESLDMPFLKLGNDDYPCVIEKSRKKYKHIKKSQLTL